jgi:hypothetical protein
MTSAVETEARRLILHMSISLDGFAAEATSGSIGSPRTTAGFPTTAISAIALTSSCSDRSG